MCQTPSHIPSFKPQNNPHLTEEETRLREMKWLIKEHNSGSTAFLLSSDPEFSIGILLYS